MSFSVDTKNEVANLETGSKSCNLSELAALVRTNATITISFRDELTLKFATESSPTARRIFRIIKSLYGYDSEIRVTRNDQLRKKSFYILHINDEEISRFLLEDTGFDPSLFALDSVMNPDKNFYPTSIVDKRAFLRGAFLGAGSVTDPNKTYHLEIVVNSEQTGNLLIDISKELDIIARLTMRKSQFVYYLKDSEIITEFLSLIGANNARLELENVRVMRDLRNNVNRIVNAETANISKIIDAAVRQIDAIELIKREKGLDDLPPNLRELAELRLEYPEESLKFLGEMLEKPVAKSTVNNRMNKIISIADEIKNKNVEA
ncbi:DNA-binding protein WhiA [Microaceticoccus formicicus]|uniref:DNA-binding protein WhiA n=1 Tax=Microaceticoccus formicicus TaxID=3118105 RepID=UPI003CD00B39|nr:DNA-binding protein WhiA [Peptoniphilaceae bacterium AMB_02]